MDRQVRPEDPKRVEPRVEPATEEGARRLLPMVRAADRREALANVGVPLSVLLPGAAKLPDTFIGYRSDGEPVTMFGVSPVVGAPSMGMVWLVASRIVDTDREAQMAFLRGSLAWIEKLNGKYPVLGNHVDERNELHVKWVRWLGFKVLKRVERWGAEGRPFLQIIRTKDTTD